MGGLTARTYPVRFVSTHVQPNARGKWRGVYRRMFIVASALTCVGFLFWPLELDVYRGPDGPRQWCWNEEPSVSTETAQFWHYYSLRPMLYATALLAVVSVVLYKHEDTTTG